MPSALLPAAATTVDAAAPQLLGGVRQRLAHVGAARVDAEGEVQHADPEPVRVAVAAHPVERHQNAHEAGDAVGAGDLDADEARARRDALVAGRGVVARDHAGHVRAVAERVEAAQVAVVGVLGEVGAADELARAVERRDAEHARVDQRDVDAGAGEVAAQAGGRADQVDRGARPGGRVVGGGDDGGDRVGDRVLDGGDAVLADGDRVGRERRAGGRVGRGVGDRVVRDLVGREVGGDLGGRRVDRRRRGPGGGRRGPGVGAAVTVSAAGAGADEYEPEVTASRVSAGSTGAAPDSVSGTSRATVRTALERRSRASEPAGTRAVKPCTIGSRRPTSPPTRRTSRSAARVAPGSAATTTWTRSGAACATSGPSSASMSASPRSGRIAGNGMPAVSAPAPDPLLEHRSRKRRPVQAARGRQSSRVAKRFSSAAARASRIGPSSKRSTSSAMKPSITSRVEVLRSSPRERR